MMVMIYKTAALRSDTCGTPCPADDVPVTPLSVKTARRILDLARLSLGRYPSPATASYEFGAFRCYVAYGCMVNHLSSSDPTEPGSSAVKDLKLLEQVAHCMSLIAETDQDLLPLARTLHDLNEGIHMSWKEKTGGNDGITGEEGSQD